MERTKKQEKIVNDKTKNIFMEMEKHKSEDEKIELLTQFMLDPSSSATKLLEKRKKYIFPSNNCFVKNLTVPVPHLCIGFEENEEPEQMKELDVTRRGVIIFRNGKFPFKVLNIHKGVTATKHNAK